VGETATRAASPLLDGSPWRTVANTAFGPGEHLAFEIKWGVITGGYASLAVDGIEWIDGRPAYHLVSEARSAGIVNTFYKVRDRNDAWLDQQALVSVRYEKRIREGKYRIEETADLDQVAHRYVVDSYRIDKDRQETKEGQIPPHVLDVFGSLYYVRTLPLAVGASYTMDVFSNGKVFPLVVKVLKREKVKVPAGKYDCFRVQPILREPGIFVSKGRKLEVWLTADERRMPVRMRSEVFIGHVAADLIRAVPAP
jgi:hypothetical protein